MNNSICFHIGNNVKAAENHLYLAKLFEKEGFRVKFICDGNIASEIIKKDNKYEHFTLYEKETLSTSEKNEVYDFIKNKNIDLKKIYYSEYKFRDSNNKIEKVLIYKALKGLFSIKKALENGFNAKFFIDFSGDEISHNLFYITNYLTGGKIIYYRGSLFPGRVGFSTNRFGIWRIPKFEDSLTPTQEEKKYIDDFIEKYFIKKTVFWGSPQSRDVKIKVPAINRIFNILSPEKRVVFFGNLKRYFTKKLVTTLYEKTSKIEQKRFYYFPLHYPKDSQLTFRGKPFVDQVSLALNIAEFLPFGTYLVVKEHPHARGAIPYRELKRLKKNKNIILLHPWENSHDILVKSKAVIIINSTVGLEAYYHGVPVICFGINYLYGHEICNEIREFYDMYTMFDNINKPKTKIYDFLIQAYRNSYDFNVADFIKGLNRTDDLKNFKTALINFLNKNGLL